MSQDLSDAKEGSAKTAPAKAETTTEARLLRRSCSCGRHTIAGGTCHECSTAEKPVARRAKLGSSTSDSVPDSVHAVLRSPGQQLDSRTVAAMKPHFGRDFSNVRVHTDSSAARSASAVNAMAYTVGRDIVFGDGYYAPGTLSGRSLLAHELTHVAQNATVQSASSAPIAIGPSGDRFEAEADDNARAVARGGSSTRAISSSRDAGRLSRATFKVGKAKVEIDYGNLIHIPVSDYESAIESRFTSWTGSPATTIHTEVTALNDKAKEWVLFALDLLVDNPVAGLDKVTAVKRLIAYAPSAKFRALGTASVDAEKEALAVSGWFEQAIPANLGMPNKARLNFAQGKINQNTPSTGSSSCPSPRAAADQLNAAKLQSDLPGQLENYLKTVVVPTNVKTQPMPDLLKVADAVQARARSFYSPYADRSRGSGNTILQQWKYSAHLVSSQSPAGTPHTDLRLEYLDSRARIVGSKGLFSQVHFDPRCSSDDTVLEGIVQSMEPKANIQALVDPILRQKSYTIQKNPKEVMLNPQVDTQTSDCDARWNTVRTLCHELMHVMVHEDFRAAVKGRMILKEGFPEVLGHYLYQNIAGDASMKSKMEAGLTGGPCASIPTSTIGYPPFGDDADKVRIAVTDDRFRAAFFLGRLELAGIQPALIDGEDTTDRHEREANAVARAVSESRPAPQLQRSSSVSSGRLNLGPGRQLDPNVRSDMESRLGHDFSHVRIHTDQSAAQSASAIRALAYTAGRDVVFGPGQYSPHTHAGRGLIAHELTHVVQQRGAGGSNGSLLQRKPDPKPDGGPKPKKKAPAAPTAASAPRLDLTPSKTGQACACLVVVHNDERNARKTAQLMHDNCSYNLALLEPDKPGAREVKIPGQKGTVDPNSLFPRDIAEQCMTDEKSCRDFLTSKSGTTDNDEIEKFVHIQFFLTISDCSKAFALPVVALHNNDIEDTKNYLKSKDTKGVEDLKLDVDKSKKETGADQIKKLKDLIRKKFGEDVEKETMETAGKTNIFRWCASPDLSKCHIGDPDHPDNITWVTNDKDYDTLSKQKVNVALQSEIPKSKKSESEGDLSTLFLILKELISADLAKSIEKLDKQIDLDLDEVDRVFKELEKLKEFGDLTLDAELKSIFAIISALIDALINALSKTITTAGSAARISKLRYVNIETPGKAIADQTDAERVRNYQAIVEVLKALGLHCCGDDPTKAEKNIESGLTLGGGK